VEVASPWPACWSSMCQMNFGLLMRYLFQRRCAAPDKAYATTVGQHSSPRKEHPEYRRCAQCSTHAQHEGRV
jgi:hypothetical protein